MRHENSVPINIMSRDDAYATSGRNTRGKKMHGAGTQENTREGTGRRGEEQRRGGKYQGDIKSIYSV